MNPITTDDLGTFLGLSDIDEERAQMLLDDAVAQASAIASIGTVPDSGATWANLPNGAEGVIRGAVGRLYQNIGGATAETVGPYSVTRPAPSGALFSDREVSMLRNLAGRGGAFSVDPTPADAGTALYPWDRNFWFEPDEFFGDGEGGGIWF